MTGIGIIQRTEHKMIGFFKRYTVKVSRYVLILLLSLVWYAPGVFADTNFFKNLETPFYDPGTFADSCGSSLVGSDHEEMVWNYFKGRDLSDEQVAGIMGNMQQESSFNPLIMQKGGESKNPYDAGTLGWGLIQWSGNTVPTGDKVTKLYNASGLSTPIYELSTQLDLVWHHMNNDPIVTQPFSLSEFKQINDEKKAADYFLVKIEAPQNPQIQEPLREGNATKILQKYKGLNPGSGGATCGGNGACKVVYEGQYSQQQLSQIFGSPGTAASHPNLHLVSVNFLGHTAQVSPLVAPCLKGVAQQIQAEGISYEVRQFGCYRFDSDNGGSNIGLKSYHTYGAACDINWDTNPWSGDGSSKAYDMPQEYIKIFHDYGFTWGGDWHSVKDYMHFEWHGVVP
jgi:hypothetical protein